MSLLPIKSQKQLIITTFEFMAKKCHQKVKHVAVKVVKGVKVASFLHSIAASIFLNPFYPNVPSLHPLKTSENQRFFDIFRGQKWNFVINWVMELSKSFIR